MKDDFGDRMKSFENKDRFVRDQPVIVRIDGKKFSKWTKGLVRPYDQGLSDLMVAVTSKLVKETGALIGYTQSDEITLVLYNDNPVGQTYLDGRPQKLTSILASLTTGWFNELRKDYLPHHTAGIAFFDARAYVVPGMSEAANALLWREMDATRNAVSMAAHHHFSHSSLQGANVTDMKNKLLADADVNFDDYPVFFKRGTFVQRKPVETVLSNEVLAKIPEKDRPAGAVVRKKIVKVDMPSFVNVINRIGVVFEAAEPVTE